MITIPYNPEWLMINAPHGANPVLSVEKWIDKASQLLKKDGYENIKFEEVDDLEDCWLITDTNLRDHYGIDWELDKVFRSDWYVFEQDEPDYEYMGGR